jgi:hypothetical protein
MYFFIRFAKRGQRRISDFFVAMSGGAEVDVFCG